MSENNKTRKKRTRTFKSKDFLSGDGMLTAVWGPSMWHYLHTMSFNYPVNPTVDDKKYYKTFVINLQNVLPCKYCRQNLKNNFKLYPINSSTMKDRDSFSRYIYNLHEIINKLLGKKSNLSYCDVRERYEHFRARCTLDKPKILSLKNHGVGCTEPLHGKKAKCVIKIVPEETKCDTLEIDKKCIA